MAGLDSRVCMAGLVSRVSPGGTKYTAQWAVRGDHNFGGTVNSMTPPSLWAGLACEGRVGFNSLFVAFIDNESVVIAILW